MSISRRFYVDRSKATIVPTSINLSTSINSNLSVITFNLSSNLNANTTLKFSLPDTSNTDFVEGNTGTVLLDSNGNATITRTLNKYLNYSNSNINTKLAVTSLADINLINSANFVIAPFTPIGLTGGTTSIVGANTLHTFTSSDTFTVSSKGDLPTLVPVRFVAIGGGGAGGPGGHGIDSATFQYYYSGAGGGAGGVKETIVLPNAFALTDYDVTIGQGGNANIYSTTSTFNGLVTRINNDIVGRGSNTVIQYSGNAAIFANINAVGGGVGGANSATTGNTYGNGGSGGGAGCFMNFNPISIIGVAVSGQGSNGGHLANRSSASLLGIAGGGGGGYTSVGSNASTVPGTLPTAVNQATYIGGNGGTGYDASNISGTAIYLAGGGGGGLSAETTAGIYSPGTGGSGSGGNGSYNNIGQNAVTYGGGGGGGGYQWGTSGGGVDGIFRGGNGKEGILYISYESRFRVLKLA